MNLCVTVEGSPRVNALPSSSSSTWPEMSNKSNPVSLLPHLVYIYIYTYIQGVSRLVDITAAGDFLDLCDQKIHINMCPILDGYGVMGIF